MKRFCPVIAVFVVICKSAAAQFPYDVPYVPTPQVVVDEMLRLAHVGPSDFVIDLGSGDGRILISAAQKFGARGFGVDLDGELVQESVENARAAGVEDRIRFVRQDLFKTDVREATVIAMYLLPRINLRLRPTLLDLKPGTRIVSHDFDMNDWRPDAKTTIRKNVFLWIVPAKVQGRWWAQIPLEGGDRKFEFDFLQHFQDFDGTVMVDGKRTQFWEPKLRGDRISFVVVDNTDREDEASLYFDGRVTGNAMEGMVRRGVGKERTSHKWRALRIDS